MTKHEGTVLENVGFLADQAISSRRLHVPAKAELLRYNRYGWRNALHAGPGARNFRGVAFVSFEQRRLGGQSRGIGVEQGNVTATSTDH